MGTLITVLAVLFVLGKALYGSRKRAEAKGQKTRGRSLLDELERRMSEFEAKTEESVVEAEEPALAPQQRPIKTEGMSSYAHPEFEGTGRASTVMTPLTQEAEEHLEVELLGEEVQAGGQTIIPRTQGEKRALLRKGVVLKEILDLKYV